MNLALLCLVISSMTLLASGSSIRIHVTPAAFTPLLTKEITLTCALGGNSSILSTRDASGLDKTSDNNSDQQQNDRVSTFRTVTDYTVVTSVVVARNGQDIASVSEHYSAAAFADHSNVKVKGNVSTNLGDVTYLTLTWSYPDASQRGNYSCRISGYDRIGHSVSFYGNTVINQEAPTIDDLVAHVYAQEVNMRNLDDQIDILKMELKDKDGEIGSLKTELRVHEIKTNITISQIMNHYEAIDNATNILEIQNEKQGLEYQALKDTFTSNHQAIYNSTNCLKLELYNQERNANISRSSISQKLNGFEFQTNLTQTSFMQRQTNNEIQANQSQIIILQRLDSNDIRASQSQTTQAALLQQIKHNEEHAIQLQATFLQQMKHNEEQAIQSQAALLQQIQALTSRIDAMEVSPPRSSHVETGAIRCGSLGTDVYGVDHPQSKDIPIKFNKVYDQPPHVAMPVQGNFGIVVSFSQVTTQGFTVTCRLLDPARFSNNVVVTWQATLS